MLVADAGDEMCWRQLRDVGDGFNRCRPFRGTLRHLRGALF